LFPARVNSAPTSTCLKKRSFLSILLFLQDQSLDLN
jgi:hypothetical protein